MKLHPRNFFRLQTKVILFTALILALWGGLALILFQVPVSPYIALDGDRAEPNVVKVGDIVTVYRNFAITRNEPIVVTRSMAEGDCHKGCEIIDLPSSVSDAIIGEYHNVQRDQIIPMTAHAGKWKLIYNIRWQDSLGRYHSAPLPIINITILDSDQVRHLPLPRYDSNIPINHQR